MRKGGPNYLLWAFVLVSVGIHAILFVHFNRMPRQEKEIRIEVEMGRGSPPPARMIPQPPSPPEMPAPSPRAIAPEMPAKIPDSPPVASVPMPEQARDVSPEVPPVPDLNADPRLPIAQWHGPEEKTSEDLGSQADYFSRVRFAIEKKKMYPPAARRRRIEGRVLVRFMIGADGALSGLSIVEGSRFDILDEAALAAVRAAAPFPPPPAGVFDGALDLTVPMMFELVE